MVKEEKKERYVVAKGVSFVGNKKHYIEGDEIDESAFKKPEQFKKLVTAQKIVIAPPESKKPESGKPESGKPEAEKPEAGKPEAGKPEAEKPEAGKPEAGKTG